MSGINKILVPVDFSSCSKQALEYAVELAERYFGASIDVLHVWEPPRYIGLNTPILSTNGSRTSIEQAAKIQALKDMEALVAEHEANYAFDTAPFVVPDHSYEYDLSLPPRLVAIDKLWTLEGVLYGNDAAALSTAWEALKAKIEDLKNYPDGIELLGDGTVFESISVKGGYDDWRIERLVSPKTDLQWRGELRFTLKILGRRRIPGLTSPITKFTQTETWAYDEAGLLTRTLAGELEVASGSATAQARTLGLKVPDNTFGVVTNGPEGVDVERLDPADLKARYTSTIKQSGTPLPDGCAPNFTVDVETSVQNGLQTTSTRVHATGTGALAAVQSHLAPGWVHETVSQDANTRSAQGVFIEVNPPPATSCFGFSVSQSPAGTDRSPSRSERAVGRPLTTLSPTRPSP